MSGQAFEVPRSDLYQAINNRSPSNTVYRGWKFIGKFIGFGQASRERIDKWKIKMKTEIGKTKGTNY